MRSERGGWESTSAAPTVQPRTRSGKVLVLVSYGNQLAYRIVQEATGEAPAELDTRSPGGGGIEQAKLWSSL